MTATTSLDVKGRIAESPIAEVLVEISQNGLSGSLRISHLDKKAIVYLKNGSVAHAVSNAKDHRLFTIGLKRNSFGREVLAKFPAFANDLELAAHLTGQGILKKDQLDALTVEQVEAILVSVISLRAGEWLFSPHSQLRADISLAIDPQRLMLEFGRCSQPESIQKSIRSVDESFSIWQPLPPGLFLQPNEKFVIERIRSGDNSIAKMRSSSTLPDRDLFAGVYSLWLGGFLARDNWSFAFSASNIDSIRGAKLKKVNSAAALPKSATPVAVPVTKLNDNGNAGQADGNVGISDLSLIDYLDRSEAAETHYDLLGIDETAAVAEIKNAYLVLAKAFHPDRFHRETSEQFSRIQHAFTKLAHAYETLRSDETRRSYDFKMKKELEKRADRKKQGKAEETKPEEVQAELALTCFEEGLELYQQEDFAGAATQLARAVHYSSGNALYHAYFGAAMSYLGDKYRHRAEAEFQAAVKLEPKNSKIRMMLVDFLIDMNMTKRAEGELRRFLEMVPGDREATHALDRLTRAG